MFLKRIRRLANQLLMKENSLLATPSNSRSDNPLQNHFSIQFERNNFFKKIEILILGTIISVVPLFFLTTLNSTFDFSKNLVFKTALLLLLVVFAIEYTFSRKIVFSPRIFKNPIVLCFGILFVIFFFSTLFSQNAIQGFYGTHQRGQGFVEWIFYFLFFVSLLFVLSKERIRKLSIALLISAFFISCYSILQWSGIDPFFKNFDTAFFVKRVFSTLGNPDFLGQFLAPMIPLCGALFIISKKWGRVIFGVFLAIIIAGLFLSQSRAPILGLMISFFIFIAILIKKYFSWKKIGVIAITIVFLFITVALLPTEKIPLLNRFAITEDNTRSIKTRFLLWESALKIIRDHPLLGVGLDSFNIHFPQYVPPQFFVLEENLNTFADRTHNEFLEFGVAAGIPALLAYGALVFFLLRTFFYLKQQSFQLSVLTHGVFLSIFVIIFQNLVAFSELSHFLVFFFLLASAVVLTEKPFFKRISFQQKMYIKIVVLLGIIFAASFAWHRTVFLPAQAENLYTQSLFLGNYSYDSSIETLKTALATNPYYAFYWYELLMKDSSSLPRALFYIQQIEGNTIHALAWDAVRLSYTDPRKSFRNFEKIIALNTHYPHTRRAYADALYRNKHFGKAAREYEKFLEVAPSFWKWKFDLKEKNLFEQKQYRIFFSNVPDFNGVLERLAKSYEAIKQKEKADYYRKFL